MNSISPRNKSRLSGKKNPAQVGKSIMGFTMGVLYLACGVSLFMFSASIKTISPEVAQILGSSCLLYGCFRLYRAYSEYQNA